MDLQKARSTTRKPNKSRGPSFYLTQRDLRIMKYIWNWKIASTTSIHEAINRPLTSYSTYKVLERLEQHGFIESRFEYVERFYMWQLTERGFVAVRGYLGELKEDGYLSENHRHDRLVQAFQLGEWSTHQLSGIEFCTEQLMRRTHVDQYPDWIPHTSEHRPDGYTKIDGAKRTLVLAYEVELSVKKPHHYEGILKFYRNARTVERVMWLVSSTEVRDVILRAKACIKDESTNFHVFVDLKDFVEHGWDASIFNERSENLFTMREKYRGICGDLRGEIVGKLRGNSSVSVHLAPHKVLGKSRR